jgi:hypothetical protein
MGYRHYFFEVDKKDVDKVKDKTYEELVEIAKEYGVKIEEDDYFNFNNDKFMNKKEIFEFGKLYWDDTAARIYSKGVPLFKKEEVQEYFEDYTPYVMGSDGMLEAINIYKNKIISYYKDLLQEDDPEILNKSFMSHIDDMLMWWERLRAINTDLQYECITSSWLYEHQIFELVRLYKSIDWENKCLLFYGW